MIMNFVSAVQYSQCTGYGGRKVFAGIVYLCMMLLIGLILMRWKANKYSNALGYLCWGFLIMLLIVAIQGGSQDSYGMCYMGVNADSQSWIVALFEMIFWIIFSARTFFIMNNMPAFKSTPANPNN
jgi:hypothetical protein